MRRTLNKKMYSEKAKTWPWLRVSVSKERKIWITKPHPPPPKGTRRSEPGWHSWNSELRWCRTLTVKLEETQRHNSGITHKTLLTSGTELFHPHLAIKKHKKKISNPPAVEFARDWRNSETSKPDNCNRKSTIQSWKITGVARTGDGLQRLKMKKAATEVDVSEVGSVGPPPVIRGRERVVDVTHVAGFYTWAAKRSTNCGDSALPTGKWRLRWQE